MEHSTEQRSTTQTLGGKEELYQRIFGCTGAQEKKELLRELSEIAKMRMELGTTEEAKVNDVLLEMFSSKEHSTFSTFNGWKAKGFQVRKGQKGFFIWSAPIKGKKKQETDGEEEQGSFKFFGLAHIFSNAQVDPVEA